MENIEGIPQKKFTLGVEMEGRGKDGSEIEGGELYEEIAIDAPDEKTAREMVMKKDFGNRQPTGFIEILKTE